MALPSGLSTVGLASLSPLELSDTGRRWAYSGVGKHQTGEARQGSGKRVFPRRKAVVWAPREVSSRRLGSSLTGWVGVGKRCSGVRELSRLDCPGPQSSLP